MAKYETFRMGDSEFDYLAFPIITRYVDYDHTDLGDTSTTFLIPIQAGTVLLGVIHQVTEGFTNAVEPAEDSLLNIGDGTDADAYLDETDLTPKTLGNLVNSLAKANAKSSGAVHLTDGVIKLTFTQAQTGGAGRVHLLELDTNTNWRTAGLF
jgi:hypothetical protein